MSEKRKMQKYINHKHISELVHRCPHVSNEDLIRDIVIRSGLEFSQVKKAVYAIAQVMKDALSRHENVFFHDLFEFRTKFISGTQCCRNPLTGEKLVPKDYYRIRFYPSVNFRKRVNDGIEDNQFIYLRQLKKELKAEKDRLKTGISVSLP